VQIDVLLTTVAFAALAAAFGFGVLTWRVLRDERRRAEARVAALAITVRRDSAGCRRCRPLSRQLSN
jgi:hypothetical protein